MVGSTCSPHDTAFGSFVLNIFNETADRPHIMPLSVWRSLLNASSTPSTDGTATQSETTTGSSGPGFGAIVALVALASVLV
jgi:PGF-CTERM protein